jgi:ribose transport system substrate-binding protein
MRVRKGSKWRRTPKWATALAALLLGLAWAGGGVASATTHGGHKAAQPKITLPKEPFLGVTVNTSKFKKKPPYTIAFADAGLTNSFLVMEYAEFKWGVGSEHGLVKPIFTNAEATVTKQIGDIDSLLTQHVDAIILNATDASALCPSITKAESQGVPVFVVERAVNCSTYTEFLNDRDDQDGYLQGEFVASRLHGKGNVVVVGGHQGNGATEQEVDAGESVLKHYPGIHILTTIFATYTPSKCEQEMRPVLARYPSIQAIESISGNQGIGCYNAVKQAGRVSQIKAWTGDTANAWMKVVARTHIASDFTPIPVKVAYYAVRQAVKALEGKPIPKDFIVPKPNITSANVQHFARMNYPTGWWYTGGMPCSYTPYCKK